MPESGRADVVVAEALAISRAQVQGLIREGRVRLGSNEVRAGELLCAGDTVAVLDVELAGYDIEAQVLAALSIFTILFEDEYLLALAKPAEMHSVGQQGKTSICVEDLLRYRYAESLAEPCHLKDGGLVQRLDYYTSGVLLAAKSESIRVKLSAVLQSVPTEKHYLALVEAGESVGETAVRAPIALRRGSDRVRVFTEGTDKLRRAEQLFPAESWISCESANEFSGLSIARVRGVSFRRHQVRAHLAHLGMPLVGDNIYGSTVTLSEATGGAIGRPGFLLHAERVIFLHPVTGERMEVTSNSAEVSKLCPER